MTRIPCVIDNVEHRLGDILNDLLREQPGRKLDIVPAYFSIRGFEKPRETLPGVRRFRLLLVDRLRRWFHSLPRFVSSTLNRALPARGLPPMALDSRFPARICTWSATNMCGRSL
jgi:hypothetical protein